MLGKIGVDRFTGPRRETYVRYEFGFKIILKALGCKQILFQLFFRWISKQQLNLVSFLSDWYYEKLGFADLPGHDGKVMPDEKMIFKSH